METTTIVLGTVGVDSGQILLCDPCYMRGRDAKWFQAELAHGVEACLDAADHAAQLHFKLGHAGLGVVLSPGYGDGIYEVTAQVFTDDMGHRHLKSITLEFIEDEAEEADA